MCGTATHPLLYILGFVFINPPKIYGRHLNSVHTFRELTFPNRAMPPFYLFKVIFIRAEFINHCCRLSWKVASVRQATRLWILVYYFIYISVSQRVVVRLLCFVVVCSFYELSQLFVLSHRQCGARPPISLRHESVSSTTLPDL